MALYLLYTRGNVRAIFGALFPVVLPAIIGRRFDRKLRPGRRWVRCTCVVCVRRLTVVNCNLLQYTTVSLPGFGGRHVWPKAGHNNNAHDMRPHAHDTRTYTTLPRDQKRPQPVLDQKRVFAKTVKNTFQKVLRPGANPDAVRDTPSMPYGQFLQM